MEYCDIIWSKADSTSLQRLLRLQKRGARIILQKKIREDRSTNCIVLWIGLLQQLVTWPIISKLLAAAKWISELQIKSMF